MLFSRDQVTISSSNLSPVVSICSIVCLIVSTLSVAGRLFTKAKVIRRLALDDITILIATFLSVGQNASVLSASGNGLGRQWGDLGESSRISCEKALYASTLLFILVTVLVKLSIIFFLRALAPITTVQKTGDVLGAIVCVWGLASFLAAAFPCSVPRVWQLTSNSCIGFRAFNVSFDVINILTELILILWPTTIIVGLHASRKRRTVFLGVFACRIFVVTACIAQIVYTCRVRGTENLTFDLWPVILCQQIVQCASLTTACIPYLQPFLLSLESGWLLGDDVRRQTTKDSSSYYGNRKPSASTSKSQPFSTHGSRRPSAPSHHVSHAHDDLEDAGIPLPPAIAMLPIPAHDEHLRDTVGGLWDGRRSGSSQVGLTAVENAASVDTRRRELERY